MLAKLEALVFLGKEAFKDWNHINYTASPEFYLFVFPLNNCFHNQYFWINLNIVKCDLNTEMPQAWDATTGRGSAITSSWTWQCLVDIIPFGWIRQHYPQALLCIYCIYFNASLSLQGDPLSPDPSDASRWPPGRHLEASGVSGFHPPTGTQPLNIPCILLASVNSLCGLQTVVWFKWTVTLQEKKIL